MRVFTWCGPFAKYKASLLVASGKRHHIPITPILCYGLMDKIQSLWRCVRTLETSEIVICMDGYDCLLLRDLYFATEKIGANSQKIIFSCQNTNEHHFHSTAGIQDPYSHGLAWLNSGVICGAAGLIRLMLEEILAWNINSLESEFQTNIPYGNFNDQTLFGRFQHLNPEKVLLDIRNVISKTSAYESLGQLTTPVCSEGILRVAEAGPAILHLPLTSKITYYRYLEIAKHVLDRDLTPREVDLNRLAQISNLDLESKYDIARVLSDIRNRPSYFLELSRQSCLSLLAKIDRKLKKLGLFRI